jgi:hypothetical protein
LSYLRKGLPIHDYLSGNYLKQSEILISRNDRTLYLKWFGLLFGGLVSVTLAFAIGIHMEGVSQVDFIPKVISGAVAVMASLAVFYMYYRITKIVTKSILLLNPGVNPKGHQFGVIIGKTLPFTQEKWVRVDRADIVSCTITPNVISSNCNVMFTEMKQGNKNLYWVYTKSEAEAKALKSILRP